MQEFTQYNVKHIQVKQDAAKCEWHFSIKHINVWTALNYQDQHIRNSNYASTHASCAAARHIR